MRLSGLLCAAVAFLLYDCAATTTNTLTDSTNKDTRSLRSVDAEREDREERGIERIRAKVKWLATKLADVPISPAKLKARRRMKDFLLTHSGKQGTNFDEFLTKALKDDDYFDEIFHKWVTEGWIVRVKLTLKDLKTSKAEELYTKIDKATPAYGKQQAKDQETLKLVTTMVENQDSAN